MILSIATSYEPDPVENILYKKAVLKKGLAKEKNGKNGAVF